MSKNSDSKESALQHPISSSGASEQEPETPLVQHQHTETCVIQSVQVDGKSDNNATPAVDWWHDTESADWSIHGGSWDDIAPNEVASTDTGPADWSTVPGTDDGSWEYVAPRKFIPTELDKPFFFIDTVAGMNEFLPVLSNLRRNVPEIFCGCKGNGIGLSRDGGITFFTMTIESLNTTYIFDVQVLGHQVFNIVGNNGLSLRMILESNHIVQIWWDLRSAFEALSHHFNIHPKCYQDLQLLELISARGIRAKVKGLADSVRIINERFPYFAGGGYSDKWIRLKKEAREYLGWNGFEALEIRPVHLKVIQDCRGDTEIMPSMYRQLVQRLIMTVEEMKMGSCQLFLDIVEEESVIRAEAVWSGESTDGNQSRTRSPPIFRMLPEVYPWGRVDDWYTTVE